MRMAASSTIICLRGRMDKSDFTAPVVTRAPGSTPWAGAGKSSRLFPSGIGKLVPVIEHSMTVKLKHAHGRRSYNGANKFSTFNF